MNVNGLVEDKKSIIVNGNININQEWHILLCFDDHYALPAGVNISSIIANNQNKFLHFHLFMQDISKENQEKFAQVVSENVSITQYYINNRFKIHANNTKYFPISACLRIIAPLILPVEINKLLYVDSDTLCLNSLEELFNYNLDEKIIAAVPDVESTQISQCEKIHLKYGSYFNSGVMLYNIDNWNRANISEKALDLLNEGIAYKFPDQDVLNLLLKNNIYYLPYKYNRITLLTVGGYQDHQRTNDETVFIHYVSGSKPWFRLYLTPIYQKYIDISPWYNSKLLLANNNSPSTTRRYAKILWKYHKYFQAFFYYFLYLKHKLTKK